MPLPSANDHAGPAPSLGLSISTVEFTATTASHLLARLNRFFKHTPPSPSSPRPASLLGVLALNSSTCIETGYIVLITTDAADTDTLRGAALVLEPPGGGQCPVYPWLATHAGGAAAAAVLLPAETVRAFVQQISFLARELKDAQIKRGIPDSAPLFSSQTDDKRKEEPLLYHAVSKPVFEAIKPFVETSYLGKDYDLWEEASHRVPEENRYDHRHDDDNDDGARQQWTDAKDGTAFAFDSLRAEDYENVASLATIPLDKAYFMHLVESPVLRDLHCVVRCVSSSSSSSTSNDNSANASCSRDELLAPAVSWCLTHVDKSIGMTGTLPAFRRRGLSRKCIRRVTALQNKHLSDDPNPCFSYIHPSNTASIAVTIGNGYALVRDTPYIWFSIYTLESTGV
ncbi:hypothetical protein HDU88_006491 [Geranomyces variabilis]|nr:hypothetical protein HDU88_006491 [Geranomyces variabilis]